MGCVASGTIRDRLQRSCAWCVGVGVQSERRRSIIVWGPAGAGKSVYLASLVFWLTRDREEPHLVVLPADGASAAWVAQRTAPAGEGVTLVSRPPDDRSYRFRVYETRDADLANSPRSSLVAELTQGDGSRSDPSRQALGDAAGAMLFLPVPAMSRTPAARAAHVAWLAAALASLPETAGAAPPAVSLPVAVCLTQTDAVPDANRREATPWLESFGSETMSALRAHCARFEVFKLSALGHAPRVHNEMETVPVTPAPHGVLAPIRWILGQTGAAT